MEKKSIGGSSSSTGGVQHCMVLSFPGQGHINPMLQFGKRLQHEGMRVTLVTTRSYCNKLKKLQASGSSTEIETISDGYDDANGKFGEEESFGVYLDRFWQVGPKTLAELIEKLDRSGHHVDFLVYDSFMPWALDVAQTFGIVGAVFLTQNLAVNSIYYHVHLGKLSAPLSDCVPEISLPKLPKLRHQDMPSFFFNYQQDPAFLDLLAAQFSNIHKADWILINTFYELEKEVADWTMKIWPKLRTIGPCIPSMFLDKQIKDDQDYGVAEFKSEEEECMKWLEDKPKGSVVYVSFGSMAELNEEQIEEIACGLRESESYFLWVVRGSEESKLPKNKYEKKSKKGLVVTWCSQLRVLAHEAVGCFVTHCGWNSTLEALSLGVPTIAMPQWSDQNTNAKHISDVWKMGIRPPTDYDDDGKNIVRGEALKCCIREIMEGQRGKEVKINATHCKSLAAGAVAEGGSSHNNIMQVFNTLQFDN